jgi:hypothetical protein
MPASKRGSPNWLLLLEHARELLDGVRRRLGGRVSWALGGGTVLMLHYRHRTSRDIDIFLKDPQLLTHLTPRLNERAAAIARDYVESSSFVKLALDDGEIDFIVAPDLTRRAHARRRVGARMIIVETPVEIAVKKAFYRAAELRVRDLFDLAVVIDRAGSAMRRAAPILGSKRDVLLARLPSLARRYRARAAREIAVLPAGRRYLAVAPDIVARYLSELDVRHDPATRDRGG